MKRIKFIFLLSIIYCHSVIGQSYKIERDTIYSVGAIERDTVKISQKRAVLTTFMAPEFNNNWFVTLYGGASLLRGEDSPKLDFSDRIRPTFGFSVGKWMSPVWGVRLNVTGSKLKGYSPWNDTDYGKSAWFVGTNYKDKINIDWSRYSTYLDIELISDQKEKDIAGKFIEDNFLNMDDPVLNGYTYDVTYLGTSIDFLLSLTNSFFTYNPKRFFDLKMFGGLGYSHTFKRKNATAVNLVMQRYGFQGSFRVTKQLAIDIEPQVLILPEIFDRRAGDGNVMDGVFNLMVGLTYKFKDRNFYEPRAICNEQALNDEINRLRALLAVPAPIPVNPSFAYIVPRVEVKKERAEVGTAFLDFEVGRYRILTNFRNNASELGKIDHTIQTVLNDKDVTPVGIFLKGYASPEGNYQSNERLAENRVLALRNYITNRYNLNNDFFTLDSEPEDWAGFREKVEIDNNVPNRYEVLDIINSYEEPDIKEHNLKTLAGGIPYKYVLNHMFPSLRRTEYRIDYTVRGFSLEESREIIKTRPQHLSLNEMFAVANSYPIGSEEYNNIFETAVRLYSNDPVANLNAANVAISKGQMNAAFNYLQKAGDSPEAIHSFGIYYLLQDDLDKAESYLQKAKSEGVKEADVNLEIVQNKRKAQTPTH